MILQKLAQAIRRQDWFQVTVEVLIVIVGIFLGLQVQAWYDRQNNLEDQSRVVDYLIIDIENTISNLERADGIIDNLIQSEIKLLQLLENDSLPEKDIKLFEDAIFVLGKNPPIEGFFNGFTEENITKVQDEKLKRIIGSYLDRINDEFNLVDMIYRVKYPSAIEKTSSKALVSEPTSIGRVKNYDFDQLKEDNEYKMAVGNILNDTIVVKGILGRLLANSKILLKTLKTYQTGVEIDVVEFQRLV